MNKMHQITIPMEQLLKPGAEPNPENTDLMAIGVEVARQYHFREIGRAHV